MTKYPRTINKITPITDGIIDAIRITDNDDPGVDVDGDVDGDVDVDVDVTLVVQDDC
jgi:hypothetical protein